MQPIEILKSHALAALNGGDFAKAVSDHIDALHAHRFTENEPAPSPPHALIERAIVRVQNPVPATHQRTQTRTVHDLHVDDEGNHTAVAREVTENVGGPVHFMSSETPDTFVPNYVLIDDVAKTLAQRKDALEHELQAAVRAWTEANTLPRRKRIVFQHQSTEAQFVNENMRTSAQFAVIQTVETDDAKHRMIGLYYVGQLDQIEELREDNIDAWTFAPLPDPTKA